MYIGAWTEYRLAQEQAQNIRRQHAAQPADSSATRKGAGIYHPSLSNKGGMEVARLPDRESFRKTLESTLSSNLAADDAENISQALEPLMQRLPSIRTAVPASNRRPGGRATVPMGRSAQVSCRQQKRKAPNRRYGGDPSRYIYTRSDAGTRPAAEPTSDGTRSTLSGFSAASAPLNTASGLEEHRARPIRVYNSSRSDESSFGGQHRQGRPEGMNRTSHLPLIIDTRRRRRNAHGSDTTYSGSNHRIDNTLRSPRNASPLIKPNETCEGDEEGNSSRTSNRPSCALTPTHVTEGVRQCGDEVTPARGGYDGGATAAILRMARRRNPAGLKADFEQFWTWKRKAPTPTASNGKKGTPSATKRYVSSKKRIEMGGGGKTDPAVSRLEALERMKAVYMTKKTDGGGHTPAATTADSPAERNPTTIPAPEPRRTDNVARAPHGEVARTPYSPTELSNGSHLNMSRNTDDETDSTVQQNQEGGRGWGGGDEAVAKSGAHDGGLSFGEPESGAAVDVPDLELTESRIRQVEKYFGGSGGGSAVGSVGLRRQEPPQV